MAGNQTYILVVLISLMMEAFHANVIVVPSWQRRIGWSPPTPRYDWTEPSHASPKDVKVMVSENRHGSWRQALSVLRSVRSKILNLPTYGA